MHGSAGRESTVPSSPTGQLAVQGESRPLRPQPLRRRRRRVEGLWRPVLPRESWPVGRSPRLQGCSLSSCGVRGSASSSCPVFGRQVGRPHACAENQTLAVYTGVPRLLPPPPSALKLHFVRERGLSPLLHPPRSCAVSPAASLGVIISSFSSQFQWQLEYLFLYLVYM